MLRDVNVLNKQSNTSLSTEAAEDYPVIDPSESVLWKYLSYVCEFSIK